MHVDTDSQKSKFDKQIFVWAWSEMVWPVCSVDSKIDCISKYELMEQTDFLHAGTNSGMLKSWFNDFWVSMVKNGHGYFVHETVKSAAS